MSRDSKLLDPLTAFRTPEAPRLLTRSMYGSALALTEVSGAANHGITSSIPSSRGYLVQLRLKTCQRANYFAGGKPIEVSDHTAGAVQFHNLREDPRVELLDSFHVMHVNVQLAALDEIVDELGLARVDELQMGPGNCVRDPVIENLLRAMRPSLARPDEVSQLFLDHASTGLCVHLIHKYATQSKKGKLIRGGLAAWQERLAKEMLRSNLEDDISLFSLADACGISVRHFTRAFKQSTGMPAHQFRMMCRIEHAKLLLKLNLVPICEIALQCGFSSQSHFTRCFHAFTGASPGNWRRSHAPSAPDREFH